MAASYVERHSRLAGNIPLKPMFTNTAQSIRSNSSDEYYKPVATQQIPDRELLSLEVEDQRLKTRIRLLRLISRLIAAVLSAVTLTPQAMTIAKYLQTEHKPVTPDGQTAWASDCVTAYTYMYTGVSAVSVALHTAILIAYTRGVKRANAVNSINSYWSYAVEFGHVIVWVLGAGAYRYGKGPVQGHAKDLWGWTCSAEAEKLQAVVRDVDFDVFCRIQVSLSLSDWAKLNDWE